MILRINSFVSADIAYSLFCTLSCVSFNHNLLPSIPPPSQVSGNSTSQRLLPLSFVAMTVPVCLARNQWGPTTSTLAPIFKVAIAWRGAFRTSLTAWEGEQRQCPASEWAEMGSLEQKFRGRLIEVVSECPGQNC